MPAESAPSPTVDVVIPCYNEVAVLEGSVLRSLQLFDANPQYQWRLVVADNGSNDGTSELARRLESEHPGRVKALVLTIKGRGLALKEAWTTSEADIVAYMDVDLSTDIEHLPRLIDMIAADGCDLAIGTRLAKGSKTKRSVKREITSRGYVFLIRATFPRLKISDAQCGFKALSRKAVRALVPDIENRMWFFDTELLVLAHRRGFRICVCLSAGTRHGREGQIQHRLEDIKQMRLAKGGSASRIAATPPRGLTPQAHVNPCWDSQSLRPAARSQLATGVSDIGLGKPASRLR
jgi:glycosyltransferase involved in cell wall biosynthesis